MFKKLFKINEKNYLNIWVKKSVVKLNRKKSVLIEVHSPNVHYYKFLDGEHYGVLKLDPLYIFQLINTDEYQIKELMNKNKVFYYNGKKILLEN